MELKSGYRQTEVGVLPADWRLAPVGSEFDICNNLRMPISRAIRKRMEGAYPYYGPTGILDYINEYRVEGQFALIGEDGDHFLKWYDQPMTQLVSGRFNVNNHAHLIGGTKNLTAWFYHYFSHRDLTAYLTRQGAGRYKLTKSTLEKIPCAFPPTKAEQEAIAEALSDADAFIESLEQLLAKKRCIKQALMQQLLTGRQRLPGFYGTWGVKRLGEVANLYRENVNPANFPTRLFVHFSLPAFDAGQIPIVEPGAAIRSNKFRLPSKAILVSKLNPRIPRVWMPTDIPREAIASTEFVVLEPKETVSRGYLHAVCSSPSFCEQMELLATGTTGSHQRANPTNVMHINVPIPIDVNEQTAIATCLSDMEAEIVALEKRRDKTRSIKLGMMQALLTGRIRLI